MMEAPPPEWLVAWHQGRWDEVCRVATAMDQRHPLVLWTWPTARLRVRGPSGVEQMLRALEGMLESDERLLMQAAGGRITAAEVLSRVGPTPASMLCIGLGLCLRGRIAEGAGWYVRAAAYAKEDVCAACASEELRHLEDIDVMPLDPIMPMPPDQPELVARGLVEKGQKLYDAELFEEAALLLSSAVALTDSLNDESDLALSAEANYGEALRASGRLKEAAAVLVPLLEDMRELLQPDDADRVATLKNLIACMLDAGVLGEAIPLLDELLEVTTGAEHGQALYRRAWTLSRMGATQEVWTLYHQAILEIGEDLGHEHVDLVPIWHDLGQSAGAAGQYATAGQALHRALELAQAGLGDMHPETGALHLSLGTLYFEQEDLEKCEPHWRQAELVLGAYGDESGRPAWEAGLQLYSHKQDLQSMARVLRRLAELDSDYRDLLKQVETQMGSQSIMPTQV